MAASEQKALLNESGLPKGAEEKFSAPKSLAMFFVFLIVPRAISFGIAYAIAKNTHHSEAMAKVDDFNLTYVYYGAVLLSVTVSWLNGFPTFYKSKIMFQDSGNLRANMLIYKVNHTDEKQKTPFVVLEEHGAIGFVFPFASFVLLAVFCIGRILHQLGYAEGGYGTHAPGFMLSMIGSMTLEMLVLIAGTGFA